MTVFFHYSVHGFANVYLVGNDVTMEAVIIDPAAFTLHLLNFIEDKRYAVKAVLVTHNHAHHVDGLGTLLRIYEAQVFSSNANLGDIPCRMVADGERFSVCGLDVEALSVPGHSADSLVYRFDKLVFTGDALHSGMIGKTLSQYSNRLLKEQLARKVLCLPDDTMLFPGHGPPTTIAAEKLYNLGWKKTKAESRHDQYDLFV